MRSNANLRFRARYLQRPGLMLVAHQPLLRWVFEREARLMLAPPRGCTVAKTEAGGMPALTFRPKGLAPLAPKLLYLHGGGFTIGSSRTHAALVAYLAQAAGVEAWAVDYRLAPEHPAPAAWEDARAAFDAIAPDFVAGDSAGGNLALHLAIRRDPKAVALLSPLVDQSRLPEADFSTELLIPAVWPRRIERALKVEDTRAPEVSPIYDDLSRCAPLLVQAATGEVLERDARDIAEKAPNARLSMWDGLPHVWQMHATRNQDANKALDEIAAFFRDRL